MSPQLCLPAESCVNRWRIDQTPKMEALSKQSIAVRAAGQCGTTPRASVETKPRPMHSTALEPMLSDACHHFPVEEIPSLEAVDSFDLLWASSSIARFKKEH